MKLHTHSQKSLLMGGIKQHFKSNSAAGVGSQHKMKVEVKNKPVPPKKENALVVGKSMNIIKLDSKKLL